MKAKPSRHIISTKSAPLVIAVAFNTISAKYISRSQLVSASKTLKLKIKSSLAKEEYYLPVVTALVEQGFVKVTCTGDKPQHVNRDNIVMLKSF